MALKKENLEKLKTTLAIFDVDKLIEAIKAEGEVDYEIPEVVVMKQEDLTARDNNLKKTGKDEGRAEGEKEIRASLVKEVGKRLGIELKGERIGDLVNELEKIKNTTNDEKIKSLQDQILLLQKDKESLSTQVISEQQRAKQALFDAELITYFPPNRDANYTDAERLLLTKSNISFEEVDGKLVAKRGGEILRDKNTQSPLPIKQVISDLFTEKKWVADAAAAGGANQGGNQGGRGGKDVPAPTNSTSGLKKLSQFEAKWKEENPDKSSMSPEFTAAVSKHAKENSDFDMYN